jgi:hypothetical protein
VNTHAKFVQDIKSPTSMRPASLSGESPILSSTRITVLIWAEEWLRSRDP